MPHRKNILFVSSINTHFKWLLPFAIEIKNEGTYNSVFYFETTVHELADADIICKQNGIEYIIGKNIFTHPLTSEIERYFRKALKIIAKVNAVFFYLYLYRKIFKHVSSILKNNNIQAVILAENSAFYYSPFFILAAKKQGIKTIVLPFSVSNHEEYGYYFQRQNSHKIDSFFKKIFYKFFKKWSFEYKNINFFIQKPAEIIAKKLVGIAVPNPTSFIGGNADKILLESQFIFDYYKKNGIDGKKMQIGGLAFLNRTQVAINIKENESKKKVILWALPADWIENPNFNSYDEMIRQCAATISQNKEWSVIVSVHPRKRVEDVKFLESENVSFSSKPITELIPECTVFVASISATIRFALAYRKPIVNFDIWHLDYSEYKNILPVHTVFSLLEFDEELKKITSDLSYIDQFEKEYKIYHDDYFGSKNEQSVGLVEFIN